MNFLIADTFATSLAKLSGDDQKQVKTTAFDLQVNPTIPADQSFNWAKHTTSGSGRCAQEAHFARWSIHA